MRTERVVVVGAGMGGLVAALELASAGVDVTVLERQHCPGGKLRTVDVAGAAIDAGPTVFTMRWVFEEIFADARLRFTDFVELEPATTLARHFWLDGSRLDLFADLERSADAIAAFAGAVESECYLRFAARARDVYRALERPFMRSACASPWALLRNAGMGGLRDLLRISPFANLWNSLSHQFRDPRLRQLFARYATYCGCSPFAAPATLMLVAHVEQQGVWLVRGGMHRLAAALADAARARGARFRFDTDVAEILAKGGRARGVRLADGEEVAADAVIVNADSAAVSAGRFGRDAAAATRRRRSPTRSLSAITWMLQARTAGVPLDHHNVFFSSDYRREFDAIFRHGRVPEEPTVYICAQDRGVQDGPAGAAERLLCLINAPANGDSHVYNEEEIGACATNAFRVMGRCGLSIQAIPQATAVTTPTDFNRLFPATGGALYGPASHGPTESFKRQGSRSRLPGLYFAGGSAHPGPGVPMAALSGRLASASLLRDLASTGSFLPVVMPGGTSTR